MPTGRLGGEPALNAAWAFRHGVSEEDALKMFTLNAAEMMGMDAHLGSLDVGKDADLLVFEGHPFDYRVLPSLVYIAVKFGRNKPSAARIVSSSSCHGPREG